MENTPRKEPAPIELLLSKARTGSTRARPRIDTLSRLRTLLRQQRKRVIGSHISLAVLIGEGSDIREDGVTALSEYLSHRSLLLWSGQNKPQPEFFEQFYSLAIRMVASGKLGDESIDDIIQLAECIVRSKDIFVAVAKDLLPKDRISDLFAFIDQYGESYFTAHFEDAVLGAVAVFLGTLADPARKEND